jgi:hypothetical protein
VNLKLNGSLAAFLLLTSTVASAAVMGTLNTGSGGTVTVTIASLAFNPDPGANPSGPAFNAEVAAGTNLTFSGCPSGTLGTAGCLDVAPFAPNEAISILSPLNAGSPGSAAASNFITFAGNGVTHVPLVFSLTAYGAGSANTNCAILNIGDSCSVVPGAPLILTRTATGSQASFVVIGRATDGTSSSNYVGQFNAPIAGTTPAQFQAFFCPGGVCNPNLTFSTSTSGNFFVTAVPEPNTWAFMIGGLLMGAGIVRRRSMKKG